jgi:hypothetical protein
LVYQPPASSTFLSQQTATNNQPVVLFSQNKSASAGSVIQMPRSLAVWPAGHSAARCGKPAGGQPRKTQSRSRAITLQDVSNPPVFSPSAHSSTTADKLASEAAVLIFEDARRRVRLRRVLPVFYRVIYCNKRLCNLQGNTSVSHIVNHPVCSRLEIPESSKINPV